MRVLLKLITVGVLLSSCGSQKTASNKVKKDPDPKIYAETITSAELKEMLYTYASDEYEGRLTGQPGQKKAIEFIKKHYVESGIPAAKPDGDYFQKVPLEVMNSPTATIMVNAQKFDYKTNFVSLTVSESAKIITNEIVYVNYGIDTDIYSDYKNIDVKGKVVLIKNGEPTAEDGTYIISGTSSISKWSNSRQEFAFKKEVAIAKGAKAVLFYSPMMYGSVVSYYTGSHGRMGIKNKSQIHCFMINTTLANSLVPDLKTANQSKVVSTNLEIDFNNNAEPVDTENVAAFIKGSEKPNEIIVVSAHLDHIGIEEGEVYNGADDDGSGTVAVLEIAEAFAKAKKEGNGPKRSILFLNVTGEEKGLLGSKYYTDKDPILPLEDTVVNLNIDMIGRTDPKRESTNRNYLYLIGSDKLSTELHAISEEINSKYCNIELDYKFNDDNDPNRFYYRSDHYNFAKNNIPVIFYFNGTHDDYHKPGDTPDKIQYDLLENRTKLIFYTAWELANRKERIRVDVKQ